jgi:hypothetical protein
MRIWLLVAAGVLVAPQVSHASLEGEARVSPVVGYLRGGAIGDDGTRYVTGAMEVDSAAADQSRPVLTALDLQGQQRWQKRWDGAGRGVSVAATRHGPVALVFFRGASFDADPGPGVATVEAADGRDAVAVALTPTGELRWTWSSPRVTLTAIAALPDGAVAIAGSAPDFRGFVAVVEEDGRTRWHRQLARSGAYPQALVVAGAGVGSAIYVTGIGNAPSWGRRGGQGGFAARLGLDGELRWLRRLGSPGATLKGYSIAADEHRVAIGGLFRGRPDFDPGPDQLLRQSADADDDGFVAVLDPAGALQWVHTFGAASSDQVRGIAIDRGELYALGNQTEVVDLGGAVGALQPQTKWFLLSFDEAGAPRAAHPVQLGKALAYPSLYVASMIAHQGRLLITGEISNAVTVLGQQIAPARSGLSGSIGPSPLMIDLAAP